MPGKDRGLVGIELSREEIRAVYVQQRAGKPVVQAVGSTPAPEPGMRVSSMENPGTASVAISKLLGQMGVPSGVPVVLGIPAESVTVQTLSVPPAPDEELPTIVAGEIEHYRIIQSRGSHAFVPLTPPVKGNPNTPISVVIAAAEDHVTRSFGNVASRAGLTLAALEPLEFGHLRAAAAALAGEATAFTILVSETTTDLAVFSHDQLWFHRRLDIGAVQLAPNPHSPARHETEPPNATVAAQKYSETMLDSLAAEISRSVDYLRREYKEHANFAVLHLLIDDPKIFDLAAQLAERLTIPVEAVTPFSGVAVNPDPSPAVTAPDGFRYTAAFGLAIRESVAFSGAAARVDLYAENRSAFQSQLRRRNLTGSFVTTAAAIVLGVVGVYLYHNQVGQVQQQTADSREHTAQLESEAQAATSQQRMRDQQLTLLSQDGVPATALMDFIGTSLDAGVGLRSVSVGSDGTVNLTAEAVDEPSMLRTVETLQRVPVLSGVAIQNFAATNNNGRGLTFTVGAKTLSLAQVHVIGGGE